MCNGVLTIDPFMNTTQATDERNFGPAVTYGKEMTTQRSSGFKSAKTIAAADGLVALLNTRPHATQPDALAVGNAASHEILRPFAENAAEMDASDLDLVVRLRDALALTLIEDPAVTTAAWNEVSQLTSSATVRRVFTPAGVELRPAAGSAVLGAIVSAIQDVVEADSWSRLRVCPNHLCELAFFDATRSRTQKWDSYETCGNRANVSAHRARLRDGSIA